MLTGPLMRLRVGDVGAADEDATAGGLLEPGHEAQRGRLAAAGRAEQGEERSGRDGQVELFDRGEPGEALLDADELEVGAPLGEFADGHAHDPSRMAWNSAWYFCSSAPESERKMCACDRVSSFGKINWFSASSGSMAIAASFAPTTGVM